MPRKPGMTRGSTEKIKWDGAVNNDHIYFGHNDHIYFGHTPVTIVPQVKLEYLLLQASSARE